MNLKDVKGKVDFGLITVRSDEYRAVLKRFPPQGYVQKKRRYRLSEVQTNDGNSYLIAMTKCIEQGEGEGVDVARDMLADIAPKWLILIGIAGGVPDYEFTLGDVIVANRLQDFSVEAVIQDRQPQLAISGGPMHKSVQILLADLDAMEKELGEWNDKASIGLERPPVELKSSKFYGDSEWRRKVKDVLTYHFGSHPPQRPPLVHVGAIASSNKLVKDSETIKAWLDAARHILAVEMELTGVYRAAHEVEGDTPILAIRGISDIVGFKRQPGWTTYACHSAASFALALLKTTPIPPIKQKLLSGRLTAVASSITKKKGITKQKLTLGNTSPSVIGSFYAHVENSTGEIDLKREDQDQEKDFMNTVKQMLVSRLPVELKAEYEPNGLRSMGDTLWGEVYRETNTSVVESVMNSIWRFIHAFAAGLLSGSTSSRLRAGLKGAMLIRVPSSNSESLDLSISDQIAYEACQHLVRAAKANTILTGFILPREEVYLNAFFEKVAGALWLDADGSRGFAQYLHKIRARSISGCNFKFEVIDDVGRQLLHFIGWPARRALRGRSHLTILTTKVTLFPKQQKGVNVTYTEVGKWDREEVRLPLRANKLHWELHELLDEAKRPSFNFIKQIYKQGDMKFIIPYRDNSPFQLIYEGDGDRPRIFRGTKVKVVDFKVSPNCYLPTQTERTSDGNQILIQTSTSENKKFLRFSKVPDSILSLYEDYSDFLDPSLPTIEFQFVH